MNIRYNDVIEQKFKEARFLNVSALNRYLNNKFEMDEHLQEVYLQGEISNFKKSGKHYYFSIKDEFSEISAMMFYPDNVNLDFKPQDGTLVQVMGKVQIYVKKGTYAIVVKKMVEQGIGLLYQQFLDLKAKLSQEGLFDVSIKLPLPEYPKNVAIITAPTGDAIYDIISTFNRRLPFAKLTIYPALVQGVDAPFDLMRALKEVYQQNTHDVLIIGRGGGSFEDLSCFNDERLARLLFASPIPTVSAIGHESDYTICDFVSSYRAPTPTASAMILTKDRIDVIRHLNHLLQRLNKAQKTIINNAFLNWKRLATSYLIVNFSEYLKNLTLHLYSLDKRLSTSSPLKKMVEQSDSLYHLNKRLQQSLNHQIQKFDMIVKTKEASLRKEIIIERLEQNSHKITTIKQRMQQVITNKLLLSNQKVKYLIDKMIILNPFNLMKKGYSIIYQNQKVISKIMELSFNQTIDIRMADGIVEANLVKIKNIVKEDVSDG